MDAEQFQQFMRSMAAMLQPLQQQPERGNNQPMLLQFEHFEPGKEKFSTYVQRFENFAEMKKINNDQKLKSQMFLNSIGSQLYTTATALAAPKTLMELKYTEIVELLKKQFCPKQNNLLVQHQILSTVQTEHQSVAEFSTKLRQVGLEAEIKCECGKSIVDFFLRAQFIRGLRDNNIREKLLEDDSLSFSQIVEKAIIQEASKSNTLEISKYVKPESNVNKIYKQHHSRRDSQCRNYSDNSRFRQKSINKFHSSSRSRYRSKSRVNYEELGINNSCLRCGKNNHLASECRMNRNKLKCKSCGKNGHVERVCITTLLKNKNLPAKTNDLSMIGPDANNKVNAINNNCLELASISDTFDCYTIIDIHETNAVTAKDTQKFYASVLIEGKQQVFEIDSGTGYTLLPENCFNDLNIAVEVKPTSVRFRSYTAGVFSPIGVTEVNVEFNGTTSKEILFIVPSTYTPLLGTAWIRHLKMYNLADLEQANPIINKIKSCKIILSLPELIEAFPTVFETKIGCIPDIQCSLKLRKNAKPIFVKAREVPFALRNSVEQELSSLEMNKIITRVDTSDWGSPLVPIHKSSGDVRLCANYKLTVNKQLENAHYPIKKIDEILHTLRGSRYFSKIDLYKAYLHVEVDEQSRKIQAISTHKGTFNVNRLNFGIKTAPSEFNRIMDQILNGLEGTISYFDDIIVHAPSKEESYKRLQALMERLQKYDLHVNKNKCQFFAEKISYLGYIVEFNKIQKDPQKVEAVMKIPEPKNSDQLSAFLGMITHYGRFIPDLSTKTSILRKLLCKNQRWRWGNAERTAFIKLKEELASDRVLIPYDPTLPITVATDASPTGIAAVLSHVIDGVERPIVYASRSLSASERNYSQLDREAVAIYFALAKFFTYIYGRHFTLITDNKPLTRIFHESAKLPAMTSARLLRYAAFLSGFDYTIQHRKAEDHINVDFLSRVEFAEENVIVENDDVPELYEQMINQISSDNLTYEIIQRETENDLELRKLKSDLMNGNNTNPEYSLEQNIIFKGNRIVVPKSLQQAVLQELHRTHIGIVKMKQLARAYCTWKNIDRDIENVVKSCQPCALVRNSPGKVVTHPWESPNENFERVHIDYAGPFRSKHIFILVDAKSKWVETRVTEKAPTAQITIDFLEEICSSHGYPITIVSDNAKIFTGKDFTNFCKSKGILQKFIAPGHPATNGLAERTVQTIKKKLNSLPEGPMEKQLREILFRYYATPLACGKTPAELYLKRKIRIQLDALRPPIKEKPTPTTAIARQLYVGDRVQARWYPLNAKPTWRFGTIAKKFGHLHYEVKLDNGFVFKRHINQLIKSGVKPATSNINTPVKKKVSFNLPTESKKTVDWKRTNWYIVNKQPLEQQNVPPAHENIRRSARPRRPPHRLNDYVQF